MYEMKQLLFFFYFVIFLKILHKIPHKISNFLAGILDILTASNKAPERALIGNLASKSEKTGALLGPDWRGNPLIPF